MTIDLSANRPNELPYATAKSLRILGKIRQHPADFRVEEVPAYHPSGQGDHLFLRVRKQELSTPEAAGRVARALSRSPKDASWAGLKDRRAVTIQWISVLGGDPEAARRLHVPGVEVLEVARHPHKLRTGHLRANRFSIRIECDPQQLALAEAIVAQLAARGVPNFYGEQRFGRNNLDRARRWLVEGGAAPRDRFARKFLASTLQAAVFNRWLAARMADALFERPVPGDIMRREDSGGLFVANDLADAIRRMAAWEISPTGPIPGARMRPAEGAAQDREREALRSLELERVDWRALRKIAPGSRRSARVRLADSALTAEEGGLRVDFALPAGSYATVVLRELLKPAKLCVRIPSQSLGSSGGHSRP